MPTAKAFAASSPTAALAGTTISRRDETERGVNIEILFCVICRSDLTHGVRQMAQHDANNLPVRSGP